MKPFNLDEAIQVLETTPKVLTALLNSLPESWVEADEGPETWSAYDILGHLIHGDKTDWIPRARIILDEGKSRTFPQFDRFAQFSDSKGKSLKVLLDEFVQLRKNNIETLKRMELTDRDFAKTGLHPDFGVVTLKQLLSTWVTHDMSHLRQIARVLAKQYRSEIGPWEKYLPVVHE